MNSIKSLFSRVSKIADSVPPKPSVWSYDSSLLTTEEQEQFVAFMGSLPRPLDLKTLTDEQTRTFHYWLKLEKALRLGDSTEAEKLRRRYGVTVEQLVDRFLSLDLSSLPASELGPPVVENGITYRLSSVNYRDIRINYIERGKAGSRIDDIWRWVEYFEHV